MQTKTNHIEFETLPNGTFLEMIKVEGGAFRMGSDEYKSEQPIHEVNVPNFYLGKYRITNIQFAAFLNDYGRDKVKTGEHTGKKMIIDHRWGIQRNENQWHAAKGFEYHPVINVSWYGSAEYCNWLSQQSGKEYRLPSESEWEYAARGGNKSLNFRYAGGNKLKEVGWYAVNSHHETKSVGMKLSNELGLFDMSGNVYDWCADHWHENYEGAPKDGSPWLAGENKSLRVVRGGSWDNDYFLCRVSVRDRDDAVNWNNVIGFRVARY